MIARTPAVPLRLLGRRLGTRTRAGRRVADPVVTAVELVAAGSPVALEPVPAGGAADAAAGLRHLVAGVADAGIAADCELTLPVGLLGTAGTGPLAAAAQRAGLGVTLAGPPELVLPLAAGLPEARVVVPADRPGAEEDCRTLAGRRVRLTVGRGAAAGLAFVRCLNVLMVGSGHPAVATTDPRLVAIAGERAAWNERSPDTWEYVMPWRVRTEQQRQLAAGGYRVRVAVPSGLPGAPAARRRTGRRR